MEMLKKFKEYRSKVEKQIGKSIKRLRTDEGREYEKWMRAHLKGSGIIHETTASYNPNQNEITERTNRMIMERVKAIIAEAKLDKRLWMEIADIIMYLKNHSPTNAVVTTSYELWHDVKLNLSHLRIIGSTMYVHVPKEKRTKLDTHSYKGILIDYGSMNQYKIWDLTRNDVVVSRDVVFIEGKSINQTPAIYEESKTIHDSIMVLPGSSETEEPARQLSTPPATENADSKESESDMINSQILLQESMANEPQESTSESTRTSTRSNKEILTSTKFEHENFDKKAERTRTAKIARSINSNDEDESIMI